MNLKARKKATMIHVTDNHVYIDTDTGKHYPSVTTILTDLGFYGNASQYFTEESRQRGTLVHLMAKLFLTGDLNEETRDPQLNPYLIQLKKFLSVSDFELISCEQPLINKIYGFGGTSDIFCFINGQESILDIKSGGVNKKPTALQLAGYEILIGKRCKRYALHLTPDKANLIPFTDRTDRNVFLSAVTCWKYIYNK